MRNIIVYGGIARTNDENRLPAARGIKFGRDIAAEDDFTRWQMHCAGNRSVTRWLAFGTGRRVVIQQLEQAATGRAGMVLDRDLRFQTEHRWRIFPNEGIGTPRAGVSIGDVEQAWACIDRLVARRTHLSELRKAHRRGRHFADLRDVDGTDQHAGRLEAPTMSHLREADLILPAILAANRWNQR